MRRFTTKRRLTKRSRKSRRSRTRSGSGSRYRIRKGGICTMCQSGGYKLCDCENRGKPMRGGSCGSCGLMKPLM